MEYKMFGTLSTTFTCIRRPITIQYAACCLMHRQQERCSATPFTCVDQLQYDARCLPNRHEESFFVTPISPAPLGGMLKSIVVIIGHLLAWIPFSAEALLACHTEKGKFASVQLMSVLALTYFSTYRGSGFISCLPSYTSASFCYCAMESCSRFDHVRRGQFATCVPETVLYHLIHLSVVETRHGRGLQ